MTKKRIGLVGYYGFGNYGDELFRIVFEEALSSYELVVLHDVPKRPYFLEDKAKKVDAVDAILIGGGDLVIPFYWTDLYWEREYLARPVFICGVGVPTWGGIVESVVGRMREFFQHKNIKFISVRDIESKQWIEQNLSPHVPVYVAPDLACGLTLPSIDKTQDQKILGIVTRKQAFIDWSHINRLCDKALKLKFKIRHIILGTGLVGKEDHEAGLDWGFSEKEYIYSENHWDLTRAIGECTVLASMKFHGCLVASMYGIPSIVLIPTDKFKNFYKLLERPELVSHYNDPGLAERFNYHMASVHTLIRQQLRTKVADLLGALRTALQSELG